jgi:hypothetical protein
MYTDFLKRDTTTYKIMINRKVFRIRVSQLVGVCGLYNFFRDNW